MGEQCMLELLESLFIKKNDDIFHIFDQIMWLMCFTFLILAKEPGMARGKKFENKNVEKNSIF